jgi:hypothetical protein
MKSQNYLIQLEEQQWYDGYGKFGSDGFIASFVLQTMKRKD